MKHLKNTLEHSAKKRDTLARSVVGHSWDNITNVASPHAPQTSHASTSSHASLQNSPPPNTTTSRFPAPTTLPRDPQRPTRTLCYAFRKKTLCPTQLCKRRLIPEKPAPCLRLFHQGEKPLTNAHSIEPTTPERPAVPRVSDPSTDRSGVETTKSSRVRSKPRRLKKPRMDNVTKIVLRSAAAVTAAAAPIRHRSGVVSGCASPDTEDAEKTPKRLPAPPQLV